MTPTWTSNKRGYRFSGEVEGLLTRLSATALCNIAAGGGFVPTFILD